MADFDFSQFFNPSTWGSWAPGGGQGPMDAAAGAPAPGAPMNIMSPAANAAAAPQPGQGSGLGGMFAKGSNANNLMQNLGMQMLKPQMMQAPQIQMARPVGPGQMPQAQPFGAGAGFGMQPQPGMGSPRQLGMLGNYGF